MRSSKPKEGNVVIKLPVTLHSKQREVDESPARFKAVMAGIRSGKTELSYKFILDGASRRPGSKNWIVFPFAKQGRSVSWNRLLGFIPPEIRDGKPHKTLMEIPLVNGAELGIRGSDNEESLLGERLGRVVMDEAARHKAHIWEEILRGRLMDYRGEGLFISTPFGRNWFYKLWEYAYKGEDKEWAGFKYTTYDNPFISRDELEGFRKRMPPRLFKRDIMAEALDDEGVVYGEYSPVKNKFDHALDFPKHEFECPGGRGMDWGTGEKGDPAVCIWVHLHNNPITQGMDVLVSAEHSQQNWSVPKHSEAIKSKSAGRRLMDGYTVLDQSAFRQEGTSQTSIARLFEQENIHCVRSERDKESGISVVKALLEGTADNVRLLISDNCPLIHKAFEDWEYGKHEPDVLAGLRYILVHLVKCGKIKLGGVNFNNTQEREIVLNPNNMIDRIKMRDLNYQDLSWNDSDGCPD